MVPTEPQRNNPLPAGKAIIKHFAFRSSAPWPSALPVAVVSAHPCAPALYGVQMRAATELGEVEPLPSPLDSGSLKTDNSGYAFYLVVTLLAALSILASVFVYSIHATRRAAVEELLDVQAMLLAESGLARVEYFLSGGDGRDLFWESDSFVEPVPGYGKIEVACTRFGAFDLITSTGYRRDRTRTLQGIAGRTAPSHITPVLTVFGDIRGAVVDKGVNLKGEMVLLRGTLVTASRRPATLPGVEVTNRTSPDLPFDTAPLEQVFSSIGEKHEHAFRGSGVAAGTQREPKIEPFTTSGEIVLQDTLVVGRQVHAGRKVTIGQGAAVRGSIISAPYIVVESGNTRNCVFWADSAIVITGGVHQSQFFCRDSIWIGGTARIQDPALVCVGMQPDTAGRVHGSVVFGPGGVHEGVVVVFVADKEEVLRGAGDFSLIIGKGTRFEGYLFTEGGIVLDRAKVAGHIWCREFRTVDIDNRTTAPHTLTNITLTPGTKRVLFPLVGESPVEIIMRES